jgi:hypothetical protein
MFISEETIDDLLREVLKTIFERGQTITPDKGTCVELTGILLELKNPRARLSLTETRGKLFSCLGELCWPAARARRRNTTAVRVMHDDHGTRLQKALREDERTQLIVDDDAAGVTRQVILTRAQAEAEDADARLHACYDRDVNRRNHVARPREVRHSFAALANRASITHTTPRSAAA